MTRLAFQPTATWRRMVHSVREATRMKLVPEYHQHEERSTNYRYYR